MTSSAREPAHHASAAHNNYEPTPHSGSYPTPKSSGGSRSLAVPPARWSFLSSPVPDLSLSPAPPSTPFSFYSDAQFEPNYDPEMSGTQEVPQSPGVWGSSSPRREHFDHLSVNESGSRSGGDSSLVDPFFAMISNEGGEGVPTEEDPTLLSISQYSQYSAASDVEPSPDAPLSSTPPRSLRSQSAASSSFGIIGRPLPSASPSADPRLAFPFPEPPPLRWSFRTAGGFTSGSHGQGSNLPVNILHGNPKRSSWVEEGPVHKAPSSLRGTATASKSPPMHRAHTDPLPNSTPEHPLRPSISPAGPAFSIQPAYSTPDVRPPPPVASAQPPAARASRPRSRSRSNTVEEGGLDVDLTTLASRCLAGGKGFGRTVPPTLNPPGPRTNLVSLADLRKDGTMGPQSRPGGEQVFPTHPSAPKRPFRGSIALPPSPSLSVSSHGYPVPPPPSLRTPTHQFNYPPPPTPTFAIASYGVPPTPPPKDVLPTVPSFTSVFVDPSTQSVRISRSYPSYTLPAPPETSAPTSTTLRHRLSDWLLRRNPTPPVNVDPDATAALGDLVARAREVETRLATGTDSPPTSKAMKRRSKGGRAESFISRFSFPGQSDRSSWVRMGEEPGAAEGEKLRRREAKARKKLVDSRRKTQDWLAAVNPSAPPPRWRAVLGGKKHPASKPLLSSRRFRVLLGGGILFLVVMLAVAIGVSESHHSGSTALGDCSCENDGAASTKGGICSCSCKGNWGGAYCQLDGTCSSLGGFPIANGLASIAEDANSNDAFSSQINTTRFAFVVNTYLINSTSSASACTYQLALVALPNLPPATFPSRLDWVQEAIVWTLAMTESTSSGILPFAQILSFLPLGDSPSVPNSNFEFLAAGYTFDFSSLTVTAPPSSWTSTVNPSAAQVALVSLIAESALDRMTAFAVAASSRRSTALAHRWAELNLSTANLPLFRSAIQAASIFIPFDAGGQIGGTSVMALAVAQTANTSFPPAIGCLPSLSAALVSEINEVEMGTFGLGEVNGSASLDRSCLNRPLYGVLDLLNLRLPFPDSDPRSNLPQQGLVLSSANNPRVTIHAGETLVGALSGSSPSPSAASTTSHFGTFQNLDHIILDLLDLVSPSLARQLVAYVLGGAITPPTTSSLLSSSVPPIEVQLWGGLRYTNIDHSVSSLSLASTPTSLFFGTSTAEKFRSWALGGEQGIRWSLDAAEAELVLDRTLSNGSFFKVWNATGTGGTGTPTAVWKALLAAGLGA